MQRVTDGSAGRPRRALLQLSEVYAWYSGRERPHPRRSDQARSVAGSATRTSSAAEMTCARCRAHSLGGPVVDRSIVPPPAPALRTEPAQPARRPRPLSSKHSARRHRTRKCESPGPGAVRRGRASVAPVPVPPDPAIAVPVPVPRHPMMVAVGRRWPRLVARRRHWRTAVIRRRRRWRPGRTPWRRRAAGWGIRAGRGRRPARRWPAGWGIGAGRRRPLGHGAERRRRDGAERHQKPSSAVHALSFAGRTGPRMPAQHARPSGRRQGGSGTECGPMGRIRGEAARRPRRLTRWPGRRDKPPKSGSGIAARSP